MEGMGGQEGGGVQAEAADLWVLILSSEGGTGEPGVLRVAWMGVARGLPGTCQLLLWLCLSH